jgi:predicted transcriptional regulator
MKSHTKLLVQRADAPPFVINQGMGDPSTVKGCMERDYFFCGPDDNYEEVLRLMAKRGVQFVPVLDEDRRVVGVLSRPIASREPERKAN